MSSVERHVLEPDGAPYSLADRMSREALLCVSGIPEEAWDSLDSFEGVRDHL